jgi:hypothetical protein
LLPYPQFPDDPFPPGCNESCFCGSGQRFKRCCGSRSPDRVPPRGGLSFVPEHRARARAVDRDISVLIYLNDNHSGGELDFKRLSYTLKPKAGMLVGFPSDVRYEHMAKPVISGRRYSLASWATVTDVERVQAERTKRSILRSESHA